MSKHHQWSEEPKGGLGIAGTVVVIAFNINVLSFNLFDWLVTGNISNLVNIISEWIIHRLPSLSSIKMRKCWRCSIFKLKLMISCIKRIIFRCQIFQIYLDHSENQSGLLRIVSGGTSSGILIRGIRVDGTGWSLNFNDFFVILKSVTIQ